ncbi:hypothetical protein LTR37_010319 [Vermiconidia calcicola]|uniref:Uncharacterized protein n=1 Tax=Vermiconidia calcicola TaxID=1690605 RepID=A0ACC3N5M1_9PEZI|nr:hypothetical protein LTR37_010319 [Vermiconidia calcicola]
MADAIQSFLESYQQSETNHIPHQPTCCCGNAACAYLKLNQSALDGLEKDVSTAARLGKALLVRHETYIADSERERQAMTAHIEMLEDEKQVLEKKNATVIEENRSLLDQLEAINAAVSESDAHVINLQATLQSTQQELQKLSNLAAKTEWLERQLADYEREQVEWQSSIEAKEESEKSATRRWQKAERTLAQIEEQIERIEKEAREERERHSEIVERMQRRHAVEKELDSAAGRLKGAAAAKSSGGDAPGPNVVSHFVKDILQDNSALQMGIVELREMLNNSNEEVETLRKQMQIHQAVEEGEKPNQAPSKRNDLRGELSRAESQELHVHHHYHAPTTASSVTPKPQTLRRPKKRRVGALTPGHFTPPSRSGSTTPSSYFPYHSPTPSAAILQQTAASIPQPVPSRHRWSMQSNQTYRSVAASSGPSSPQSTTNRTSSVYDRVFSDAGLDSSRPTTPDTEEPGSPMIIPDQSKRVPQGPFRTQSTPMVTRGGINPRASRPALDAILSIEELPSLEQHASLEPNAILEVDEAEWENEESSGTVLTPAPGLESSTTTPFSEELANPLHDQSFYRPRPLRRATSHESVLSVAAMDVHTLKTRPSQLLAPYSGLGITSKAMMTGTMAHAAHPVAMSRPSGNSKNVLSGMAADQRQASAKGLGKKVGGWMFGRWGGATPEPSTSEESGLATAKKINQALRSSSASDKPATPAQDAPKRPKMRPPGINQAGSIEGLLPEMKAPPTAPVVRSLDRAALKSILNDKQQPNMVRTKNAAKKNKRVITEIKDVPVPPAADFFTRAQRHHTDLNHDAMDVEDQGSVTRTQQHDADNDEDAMDAEDQGGVALSDDDDDTDFLPPALGSDSSSIHMIPIAMYHQTPFEQLQDTTNLWTLPVARKSVKTTQKDGAHRTAVIYHKSCHLIIRHWQCDPEECIPDSLRKQTPYSLALLLSLRRLASHTKKEFEIAQSLILETWRKRMDSMSQSRDHTGLSMVETDLTSTKFKANEVYNFLEPKVQENIFGLMLVDVEWASKHPSVKCLARERRQRTKPMKQERKWERKQERKLAMQQAQSKAKAERQASQQSRLERQEGPASHIAEAVVQRRRAEKTNKFEVLDQADSFNGPLNLAFRPKSGGRTAAAPYNSPATSDRAKIDVQAIQSASDPRQTNANATDENDHEVIYDPSLRATRHRDNELSRQMNMIGMNRDRVLREKRLKKLHTGGDSRRMHQSVVMPAERLDLSSVPSLHDIAAMSPSDLARLGQQRLPG